MEVREDNIVWNTVPSHPPQNVVVPRLVTGSVVFIRDSRSFNQHHHKSNIPLYSITRRFDHMIYIFVIRSNKPTNSSLVVTTESSVCSNTRPLKFVLILLSQSFRTTGKKPDIFNSSRSKRLGQKNRQFPITLHFCGNTANQGS